MKENKNLSVENKIYLDEDNKEKGYIEIPGLSSLSRTVKQSMVTVSDPEIRYLVDCYYQTQKLRKSVDNQIRAINQGVDGDGNEPPLSLLWLSSNVRNQENNLFKLMDEFTKREDKPVCRWLRDIVGIGPVLAAGLYTYFDISKCSYAGQFWSYAGLNDNNTPWLGKEKATSLVKEAYNKYGLKSKDDPTDEVLSYVMDKANRSAQSLLNGATIKDENNKNYGKITKDSLIKYLSKIPYNKELKVLCWKVGDSIMKVCNKPKSLYGKIYKERNLMETAKNESGGYAEEAAMYLSLKNYDKTKEAYKAYSKGKLPKCQITARAKRYATKLLISHLFEIMYMEYYKKPVPVPYVIADPKQPNHTVYIGPEVPYSNYITDYGIDK